MTRFWPNGIGGTLGDSLAIAKPLQASGKIWYVSSLVGSNSNVGNDRDQPLATVSAAITASSSDDIIVMLSGHTETLAAGIVVSKRLAFIGEGSSGGQPTVVFKTNAAAIVMFALQGTNSEMRNVKFASTVSGTSNIALELDAASCRVTGCRFEQTTANDLIGLNISNTATQGRVKDCTFVSLATSAATAPQQAIRSVGGTVTDLELENCVVDAGAHGYSAAGIDFSGSAITRLKAEGISLLNGAVALLNASTTGWFNVQTSTGGGRVEW